VPAPTDPNLALVEQAAARLGPLVEELTLVGGACAGLLITDPAALRVRETVDVDLVVEAATYVEYHGFGHRLEQRGFERGRREGDPICRWRHGAIVLDIMPLDESVLGFSNRWYASAIAVARTRRLPSGVEIRHIDAPHFTATKLEAFRSRGDGDFVGSSDLEDLVRVVDGRSEIEDEFERAPHALREFVRAALIECLHDRFFIEALPEYFSGQEEGRARARIALERLRRMTRDAAP
jgi:hypothetical protein